jgi:hypothetical protein
LPWTLGWNWPRPQLLTLALLLGLSPLVDYRLAKLIAVPIPVGWLRLRWVMAGGLSLLTLLLAFA